jgi:glc operon protein GlcG
VLLQAANDFAEKNQFAVSIAVVDDGGHLLGFTRRDDCPAVSASIAQEKAKSSALGRKESKAYEDMINGGRIAYLSVPVLQGMLEGGVNIVHEGHTIGAIGVSGVKSNQDAEVAKAGIAAWQASL